MISHEELLNVAQNEDYDSVLSNILETASLESVYAPFITNAKTILAQCNDRSQVPKEKFMNVVGAVAQQLGIYTIDMATVQGRTKAFAIAVAAGVDVSWFL